MPRSRSRSFESRIRSPTSWLARNSPLCRRRQSTRVVLPWSTCAIMAILRMSCRRISLGCQDQLTRADQAAGRTEAIHPVVAALAVRGMPRPQTGASSRQMYERPKQNPGLDGPFSQKTTTDDPQLPCENRTRIRRFRLGRSLAPFAGTPCFISFVLDPSNAQLLGLSRGHALGPRRPPQNAQRWHRLHDLLGQAGGPFGRTAMLEHDRKGHSRLVGRCIAGKPAVVRPATSSFGRPGLSGHRHPALRKPFPPDPAQRAPLLRARC